MPLLSCKNKKLLSGLFVTGEGRLVLGQGHGNQVNGMRATNDGALLTCGIDDTLRRAKPSTEGKTFVTWFIITIITKIRDSVMLLRATSV